MEGSFAWDKNVMIFVPKYKLKKGKWYTVKLSTDAEDVNGNNVEKELVFKFLVGSEDWAPTVLYTQPAHGSSGVDVLSSIKIVFSEPMDTNSTQRAFSITPEVPGSFSWPEKNVLVFTPSQPMEWGTTYKVTVSGEACDLSGNQLNPEYSFSFVVGQITSPPKLVEVYQNPADPWNEEFTNEGIEKDLPVYLVFDRDMDSSSVSQGISIQPEAEFTVSSTDGTTFKLDFINPLTPDEVYTLNISKGIVDIHGKELEKAYAFCFRTNGPNSIPPVVDRVSSEDDEDVAIDPWVDNQSIVVGGDSAYKNIKIHFISNGQPVSMEKTSTMLAVSVEFVSGTGGGGVQITDFRWESDGGVPNSVLVIDIGNLFTNNIYKLKVSGGPDGAKDTNGNWLKQDFEIFFHT